MVKTVIFFPTCVFFCNLTFIPLDRFGISRVDCPT